MVRSSHRSLFLVVFILVSCGFLGMLFAQKANTAATSNSDSDVRDSLKQFTQVYEVVEENYAEPVNPDKAIYNGAIPGMLHALDPHSNFFDPKSYSLLREEQRGKYYGVGMTVGPRNNKVIVIAPFVGTPAYRAGIHPGDIIIAVDGKPTDNMSTGDVADLLKGPKGTTVRITVLREGSDKPLDFNVVRDEIPRYSVDLHFLIRPGIGYMHVSGFQETTDHEVAQALDEMGDLKGLILDLRQNPGGLLSEGVGVADKFLHKGQLIDPGQQIRTPLAQPQQQLRRHRLQLGDMPVADVPQERTQRRRRPNPTKQPRQRASARQGVGPKEDTSTTF